ncbi:hypothetical protein SDC9_163823 [bioreactor metagenome]|uniref:Uncharacterized protein n=1 Tax=bioreactor metagenome TaxID=1076179 RepID=A0A645FSS2_9ZZZZ
MDLRQLGRIERLAAIGNARGMQRAPEPAEDFEVAARKGLQHQHRHPPDRRFRQRLPGNKGADFGLDLIADAEKEGKIAGRIGQRRPGLARTDDFSRRRTRDRHLAVPAAENGVRIVRVSGQRVDRQRKAPDRTVGGGFDNQSAQ